MMTSLLEAVEPCALWLARNALHTALPALIVGWLCWRRWGSPKLRFALAALVLAKLILPPLPGFSWQVTLPEWSPVEAVSPAQSWQAGPAVSSTPSLQTPAPDVSSPPWRALLWLAGVCALAAWWVTGLWRVRQWINRERQPSPAWLARLFQEESARMRLAAPELCVLRGWPQAAVFGWRRPRVLVPEQWLARLSENEWRAVLRHELAHARRHDVLWSALGFAIATLHWFHPIGWLALRRLRAEAELLCDEAALAGQDESIRRDYGRVLIRLIEPFTPAPPQAVAAFARHRTQIQHRIHMIAQPNPTKTWSRAAAWLILPILSLALLTAGERESTKSDGRAPQPREQQNERTPAERPRNAERALDGERGKDGKRERDGDRGQDGKPGIGRDGEMRKEGPRDGERSREGVVRDGDRPREGSRDGDRPRAGLRDGDRPREGMRDSEDALRGEGSRDTTAAARKAPALVIQFNAAGEVVNSEGRVIPDDDVKERIAQIARGNPGQEILLRGEKDTRYESLTRILNLLQGLDVKPALAP
jgi:beta-lactamase regulating signal transducer with metallopeptidase domain